MNLNPPDSSIDNGTIARKLKIIHRERTIVNYVPSMMVLGIAVYFQREELLKTHLWILCFCLQVIGASTRHYILGPKFKDFIDGKPFILRLNQFAYFMSGMSMGLHAFDVCRHYGAYSPNFAYTVLIVIGIMAASSNTLQADRSSFITYITTIEASLIGTFIYHFDSAPQFPILYLTINFIYSFYYWKIGHTQMIEQLTSQENLRNIIDIVPGYVFLLNKNKRVYMANKTVLEVYPNILEVELGENDPESTWEASLIEFMNSDKTSEFKEIQTAPNGHMA